MQGESHLESTDRGAVQVSVEVYCGRLALVFNFVHVKRTAKITVGFCVHFLYVKLDFTLYCFDSFPLIMAHQLLFHLWVWLLRLDLVFSFVHEKRTAKITVGFCAMCQRQQAASSEPGFECRSEHFESVGGSCQGS